jgi:hypothetical protein
MSFLGAAGLRQDSKRRGIRISRGEWEKKNLIMPA